VLRHATGIRLVLRADMPDRVRRSLPCGDHGLVLDGRLVAAVERKSIPDPVASLTGGKLRCVLADLVALPHAAVVVEDRYSRIFNLERVRPAVVADGMAGAGATSARLPGTPSCCSRSATDVAADLPAPARRA
jgi:hypothetical protein